MTATVTPYRSDLPPGRDGFAQLLRSEWTKFRTVRGWLVGVGAAAVVMVLFGLLAAAGGHTSGARAPGTPRSGGPPRESIPRGPGGEPVTDAFYYVHQPLTGDGTITVRVTSLTGVLPANGPGSDRQHPEPRQRPGLHEWAKAGVLIKQSTEQGSPYAAIMATGSHGVRLQYNYTHDAAGSGGAVSATSPRWLRLTRSGDAVTGSESADGTHWTEVGTAHLAGLPTTVQVGMFVASPQYVVTIQNLGRSSSDSGPSRATAVFDHVGLQGQRPTGTWTGTDVAGDAGPFATAGAGFQQSAESFTVSGSGDVAPAVPDADQTVENSLMGAFAGLIAMIVVSTMFITAEHRRGLIRTTLAASPRRGRVLAAKAVVIGGVTFVAGLIASAVAFWLVRRIRNGNGRFTFPVSSLTELRLVAGTAALLAVTAVLTLAVGSVLRRSVGAVTAVIVLVVLPYVLAVASVLPTGPAQWLLRLTPAAGFAIQQSIRQYSQVRHAYTPSNGYYPLAPWAGFGVLCVWTALALALAVVLLRRRDA